MNSVVIGSGFGGIAAALRLKAKNHKVTIIEKHNGKRKSVNERRERRPYGSFKGGVPRFGRSSEGVDLGRGANGMDGKLQVWRC